MENRPNGLVSLASGLIVLVSLCALVTAAMSAAASAANAAAMAVMASALQTSQCTIMILALAVIITPVAILLTIYRLTAANAINETRNTQHYLPHRIPVRSLPPPVDPRNRPDHRHFTRLEPNP
jgi:hypothetical protein